MIPVTAIEHSLDYLTTEARLEEAMLAFAQEQTAFLQYLQTESFELLTQDERDYLQYLLLVMYGATTWAPENDEKDRPKLAMISGEDIEKWDERCWEWMQGTVGKPMATRLDQFFENIDQEELLAFAEDSLVDSDEEGEGANLFVSGPSRELGFVALAVFVGGIDEQMQVWEAK